MSIDEKIDNYYDGLLKARNNFRDIEPVDTLSDDDYDIKEAIRKVINIGMDHLLTPFFNYYLVSTSIEEGHGYNFSGHLYAKLLYLTDNGLLLYLLSNYFSFITTGFVSRPKYIFDREGNVINSRSMLTEKENTLYINYRNKSFDMDMNYDLGEPERKLLIDVLRLLTSLNLINDKYDFSETIKPYFNDPVGMIDELTLQGICTKKEDKNYLYEFRYEYDMKKLGNYILYKIDNSKNQKEIR